MSQLRKSLALSFAAALTACGGNSQTGRASVDDVMDEPSDYIGRDLTVSGEVGELQSDRRVFTLEDHDWIFPEKLLVVAERPLSEMMPKEGSNPLRGDQEVRVSGTVQQLMIAELERDYDFDLERDFELEFRERPILIASSIAAEKEAAEGSKTSATVPPPADSALLERDLPQLPVGDTTSNMGAASARGAVDGASAPVTDILLIIPVPGPRELVGKQVVLDDTPLRAKVGDRGYWVGPGQDQQVFVRLKKGAKTPNVAEGELVRLGGALQLLPSQEQMIQQWQLDSTVVKNLTRNEALYIQADSIMGAGC